MSTIASKNLYELLGNDPELDPDRPAPPPTKVIDKPVARIGKRNPTEEPSTARDGGRPAGGARGGREGGRPEGNVSIRENAEDGVRRDRHPRNTRGPREGGRGRGAPRGARGYISRTDKNPVMDRHSNTGITEHEKQADQAWGGKDGQSEWNDEKAGEEIAQEDAKDAAAEAANGEVEPAEPEEKTKSYDQYLAEQAEKRLALGAPTVSARKANEGSKAKFPEGTEVSRDAQDDYFAGSGGKKQREKEVKTKETISLDKENYSRLDLNERGGRGGGRGGRGRGGRSDSGEFRGGRGGRSDSGEFRGRGGRGRGAPRGDRDSARGARGGFNATDASAFPALGA